MGVVLREAGSLREGSAATWGCCQRHMRVVVVCRESSTPPSRHGCVYVHSCTYAACTGAWLHVQLCGSTAQREGLWVCAGVGYASCSQLPVVGAVQLCSVASPHPDGGNNACPCCCPCTPAAPSTTTSACCCTQLPPPPPGTTIGHAMMMAGRLCRQSPLGQPTPLEACPAWHQNRWTPRLRVPGGRVAEPCTLDAVTLMPTCQLAHGWPPMLSVHEHSRCAHSCCCLHQTCKGSDGTYTNYCVYVLLDRHTATCTYHIVSTSRCSCAFALASWHRFNNAVLKRLQLGCCSHR